MTSKPTAGITPTDDDYDDYGDGLDDPCDHDDYDVDILDGRAHCSRCGHAWYQTSGELAAEMRRQAEYDRYCAEIDRPPSLRQRARTVIAHWRESIKRPFRRDDPEIPF